MSQEDKQLLLKDLCARLPYGVVVQQSAQYPENHFMYNVADKWKTEPHDFKIIGVEGTNTLITDKHKEERTYAKGIISSPVTICIYNDFTKQITRPYLRPMSSMTEGEKEEYTLLSNHCISTSTGFAYLEAQELIEWLNKKMFDYCGLIEKGLALEAPKDMYKF